MMRTHSCKKKAGPRVAARCPRLIFRQIQYHSALFCVGGYFPALPAASSSLLCSVSRPFSPLLFRTADFAPCPASPRARAASAARPDRRPCPRRPPKRARMMMMMAHNKSRASSAAERPSAAAAAAASTPTPAPAAAPVNQDEVGRRLGR